MGIRNWWNWGKKQTNQNQTKELKSSNINDGVCPPTISSVYTYKYLGDHHRSLEHVGYTLNFFSGLVCRTRPEVKQTWHTSKKRKGQDIPASDLKGIPRTRSSAPSSDHISSPGSACHRGDGQGTGRGTRTDPEEIRCISYGLLSGQKSSVAHHSEQVSHSLQKNQKRHFPSWGSGSHCPGEVQIQPCAASCPRVKC